MKRINVRVEETLKERIEMEAAQKGTTPSDIVRQVLDEHYKRQSPPENCLELAERLGILGSIPGLPADLTTNPAYMEGFAE